VRHIDLAASAAHTTPEKVAVRAGDRTLTFRELDQRIDRFATVLRASGVAIGDRVGLLAGNVLEYPEIQGAGIRWGFVVVPLNNRLAAPELSRLLDDAGVTALIVGEHERQLAGEAIELIAGPRARLWYLGSGAFPSYDEALATASMREDHPPADPLLPVSIMYTGGTTGAPKGAVIDRSAMSARILSAVAEMNLTQSDVWLQVLPMFHIASGPPYACLARGASVVMLDRFTAEAVIDNLVRWDCTMTVLVPTMIEMLLQFAVEKPVRLEHLRFLGYGASPIDPSLLDRMIEAFDCEFQQWYGQTELGGVTALRNADHDIANPSALRSVGRPMVGYEVSVRDDDGRAVPTGAVGEIACRGPAAMAGYWNRPQSASATRDGWHYTGDIGKFDNRGFLHLVDRRNNVIITGGENVFPSEVESVMTTVPGLTDVAVFGIPDYKWGQIVAAIFVGTAAVDDLVTHASRELATYKVPRVWLTVDEIPRTALGKVVRSALAETMLEAIVDGAAVRRDPHRSGG
jgi:acyl-CoA synthetase (AMP-forming)/AMP-acid ligase II